MQKILKPTENKGRVTLVGAGLVGAFLSIYLRREGYDVEIFERRADPRKVSRERAGRSINLIVTSRGLNALEQTGLIRDVMEIVVPVYGRAIHSLSGEIAFQPYGRDRSECNYSISRAELNELLISKAEQAGVKIHFEHALESIQFQQKQVSFISQAGPKIRHEFERLISAEGAGSVVRKELIRQLGGRETETTEWLEADYKELSMPASSFDRNALHIWPRGTHMLMGLPNRDGSFTMTLYLPKKGRAQSFENVKTENDVHRLFVSEFGDAAAQMPNYADEFLKNPQGVLGTVRTSKWVYEDSVALIGDAAHAIVPFFGQGMNLGFEDCTCLMRCLAEAHGNWGVALANYDLEQRPNANAMADMALENFIEMRDKTGQADFLFRKKVEAVIESELSEIYRSRYGMITYTLIPLALTQKIGRIQDEILDAVCAKTKDPSQIDFFEVRRWIESKISPILKEKNLVVDRYRPHL